MSKLTLYMENSMINKARTMAKKYKTSISKLVSEYFKTLDSKYEITKENEITPLVNEISGILYGIKKPYKKLKKNIINI